MAATRRATESDIDATSLERMERLARGFPGRTVVVRAGSRARHPRVMPAARVPRPEAARDLALEVWVDGASAADIVEGVGLD